MVIRLQIPIIDHDDFIDSVVQERKGGKNFKYFNGICANWKVRNQAYIASKGNPEVIKPPSFIAPADVDKFLNLYASSKAGSAHGLILGALRKRTLQICPACGEDGTPNTLDHYLPKESYPEYAITPANLSPMCDICQGEKGVKTVNATNQRLFLHPYFDDFADTQIVILAMGRPFEAPTTIDVRPHPSLTASQSALVSRHLFELGILRRYPHFFRDEYMHLLRLTSLMRGKAQNVSEQLENFCERAKLKSINSWQHVFYSSVLADTALVAYLETGNLPDLR